MEETRNCQNCKSEFHIVASDFEFYEKMQVPAPTFCPKCRFQRRVAFWNLFALYHRICDLCGKDTLSTYPPDAECVVYCPPCWYSDDWSPLEYGREYDFSRPFFAQLMDMWKTVPLLGLSMGQDDYRSSPYNNMSGFLKNCYLLFDSSSSEDSAYGATVIQSKDCFDCTLTHTSELCYDVIHAYKCSGCVGTRGDIAESLDCFFLKDSRNCQNCFASANLRNATYVMFNKQYTKEEYERRMQEFDLGSYVAYTKARQAAEEHWKTQSPKPVRDDLSQDSTGQDVMESKNCKQCFTVAGAVDSKYLFDVAGVADSYDVSNFGTQTSWVYEGNVVGHEVSRVLFCQESGMGLSEAAYCKLSIGAHNHFGCVSVRNTPYCILNKQYSPEEFATLKERIMKHMDEMPYTDAGGRVYRYGEFFPAEMSRHPYNDTMAADLFPLSPEAVRAQGWWFRGPDASEHTPTRAVDDLPDHIRDTEDSILNEVIGCGECGRGYRIILMELAFLRKMNLPLPRTCPFCRIKARHRIWLDSLKMVSRTCDRCRAVFSTNYTADEYPKILCKKCYQAEVV